MRKLNLGALIVVLALCAAAVADKPFIKPDAIDVKAILATAPSNDSQQTKDEIQKMLDLQAKRTPQEAERAEAEESITVYTFSNVLGTWFKADDLPVTDKVMKEVAKESKSFFDPAKKFYARPRPPLVDARIKPCVAMENSFSYPSGHATRATVWAIVLGEMFPDKKDALMARAKQIGDDRVLGGMHFPSDVEAGGILGKAIAEKLLADPDFKAALEKAKDECLADAHRN